MIYGFYASKGFDFFAACPAVEGLRKKARLDFLVLLHQGKRTT